MTVKKKKIGYIPYKESENAYTNRMVELLSQIGNIYEIEEPKELIKNLFKIRCKNYDAIITNWIENRIISNTGTLKISSVTKYIIHIILLRLLTKRLIFVKHNNYPHTTIEKHRSKALRIINFTQNFFYISVTHSGHNSSKKQIYIPHPLYKHQESSRKPKPEQENFFLIFGRILPYKKIEHLLEILPGNVKIKIAGPSPDNTYLEKIKKMSHHKDVEIISNYLSENEAAELCKSSMGIVITHNDPDMIVSGTFIYALSLGVPIYTVSTPFAEWLVKNIVVTNLNITDNINELCNLLIRNQRNDNQKDALMEHQISNFFSDEKIITEWRKLLI